MKTAILNNWKTSAIGLILIGVGIYMYVFGKSNWQGCASSITMGCGFLFANDAKYHNHE